MLTPLHRLVTHLIHRYGDAHPHQALPTPHRGIPDAYMEKLPPPDERTPAGYSTRDPRTRQFSGTRAPQDHAA